MYTVRRQLYLLLTSSSLANDQRTLCHVESAVTHTHRHTYVDVALEARTRFDLYDATVVPLLDVCRCATIRRCKMTLLSEES